MAKEITLEDLLRKFQKLRFTIISGDRAERRQIKKVLRSDGLPDVVEYDDFDDAWKKLQLSSTNLLAFSLSEDGGLDFLHQLIESARFKETPLLVFTDKVDEHSKLHSHADMLVEWVDDPMNVLKVEQALLNILKKGTVKKSLVGSDSVGLASYATGLEALKDGDFEKAKECFRLTLKEDPNFVEGYVKMAEALVGLKDYEAAKRVLAKARSLQNDHPGALLMCGRVAMAGLDKEMAVEVLDLLASKRPADVGFIVEIGNMALENGWPDEAIRYYEKARTRGPKVIHVYNRLGIAHSRAGRYESAMAMYELALELDEADAGIHFNIGMTHHRMGEESKALELFKTAKKLDPDMGEAHEWIEKLEKTANESLPK